MIDVLIRSLDTDFGYSIWVFDKDAATGQIRILHSLGAFEWKDHPTGDRLPKPLFSTSTRDGDIIFDKFIERLKEMGYGKDKLSIESGELKAMKEHLADMKKLVFEPPPHFAPIIIAGDNNPAILNLGKGPCYPGRVTPGRALYSTPGDLKVDAGRVRKAAKTCPNAEGVLRELFPELFSPGWKNETD